MHDINSAYHMAKTKVAISTSTLTYGLMVNDRQIFFIKSLGRENICALLVLLWYNNLKYPELTAILFQISSVTNNIFTRLKKKKY